MSVTDEGKDCMWMRHRGRYGRAAPAVGEQRDDEVVQTALRRSTPNLGRSFTVCDRPWPGQRRIVDGQSGPRARGELQDGNHHGRGGGRHAPVQRQSEGFTSEFHKYQFVDVITLVMDKAEDTNVNMLNDLRMHRRQRCNFGW